MENIKVSELTAQNHLSHHGIRGMKWGVRNEPERSPRQTGMKSGPVKRKRNKVSSEISPGEKFMRARNKILIGSAALQMLVGAGLAVKGMRGLAKSAARRRGAEFVERELIKRIGG